MKGSEEFDKFRTKSLQAEILKTKIYKEISMLREEKLSEVKDYIKFPELHDRLIIATADYLKIPILTCDERIREIDSIEAIWD